ncbi:transmembrane protein 242 [Teleopsis dalmanni]|uniref:transmembrane protein 242 n=1 Tax=Teleopsis dalmanni TaxID=139649 RepID=UPI000D32CE31|nr:transmembrane protein 242 [Teleopsis dalmanni]
MSSTNVSVESAQAEKNKKFKIQAAAFLGLVGGTSALFGFSRALTKAKNTDKELIAQSGKKAVLLMDEGSMLAMRALGWGTLYAVLGTGIFCYGIWKLSGANNMEEFRMKMGSGLPKLTKSEPPTSRTEFDGLTDLMKYLASWGKE